MRLNVNIDRNRLGEIGYQAAPIRQILKLKLSPSEQLLLLNFFSNAPDWKVSISSISKSFGLGKNRNLVKKELNKLLEYKYITLDDSGYTINLDTINSDYLQNKRADNTITSDSDTTSDSRNISNDDSNTNRGVIVSLPEGDSDTNSLSDSITNTNKINIKEKEINDNQEINPVKENLDLDSNSSIDLGFGFDLENIALKQPKELFGENYKLVNVNNVSTVVNKGYYDGISTNQEDTIISNISPKPTNTYKYLKFNDHQKTKLDLKFREVRAYNTNIQFLFNHFELLLIQISSNELEVPLNLKYIDQINDFLVEAITSNTDFFQKLVCKFNDEIKTFKWE